MSTGLWVADADEFGWPDDDMRCIECGANPEDGGEHFPSCSDAGGVANENFEAAEASHAYAPTIDAGPRLGASTTTAEANPAPSRPSSPPSLKLFTMPARLRRWGGPGRMVSVGSPDLVAVGRMARGEYRHMRRNCGLCPYDARRALFGYLVAIGCEVALVKAEAA